MGTRHRSSRPRFRRLVAPAVAVASLAGASVSLSALPARATGTNLGYACAFWTNVSLFGGPYGSEGCGTQTSPYATANTAAPSVTLPVSGAYTALTDTDGALAQYGPADIVSSPYDANDNLTNTGQLSVFTYGTSVVTSQAQSKALGPSPFWTATPTSWIPASSEGYAKAICTASSPTAKSLAVQILNGYVDTAVDANGYPTNTVAIPTNPSVNYSVPFTIQNINPDEHGVVVFNERVSNADGSTTLNAVHMYMQGPTALGDVIIAQVKCGHA